MLPSSGVKEEQFSWEHCLSSCNAILYPKEQLQLISSYLVVRVKRGIQINKPLYVKFSLLFVNLSLIHAPSCQTSIVYVIPLERGHESHTKIGEGSSVI
jgi:hypothetical protein